MQETAILLQELSEQVNFLKAKKKMLFKRLIWPRLLAFILVLIVAILIGAEIAKDIERLGGYYVLLFYGFLFAWGIAIPIVDRIVEWRGFPRKEYEGIDLQKVRLLNRIEKIQGYLLWIERIRRLQGSALPRHVPVLQGHIDTLQRAALDAESPTVNSSVYSNIRRSMSSIGSYLNRKKEIVPENQTVTTGTNSANEPAIRSVVKDKAHEKSSEQWGASPLGIPDSATENTASTLAELTQKNSQDEIQNPDEGADIPLVDHIDVEAVFSVVPNPPFAATTRRTPLSKVSRSPEDYLDIQRKNQDLGLLGELYVLRREKEFLLSNQRKDLAEYVEHVSLQNDQLGYDILSFELSGMRKYIEVKTTEGSYDNQFFLTANEHEKMSALPNYFIYRVFEFDIERQTGRLYKIDCSRQLEKYFRFETAVFKVIPNFYSTTHEK